jgi:hypothetical protein
MHTSAGAAGYECRALGEVWGGDGLLECLLIHALVCVWQSLGGVSGVDLRRYEAFPVAQMDTAVRSSFCGSVAVCCEVVRLCVV